MHAETVIHSGVYDAPVIVRSVTNSWNSSHYLVHEDLENRRYVYFCVYLAVNCDVANLQWLFPCLWNSPSSFEDPMVGVAGRGRGGEVKCDHAE